MAETEVKMPQMGESIFEGTVTKWLKKKGDKVQRDEPLFEISTDKIDTEIPSPASGVLQDILVTEVQTVQLDTIAAVSGDGSAKPAGEAKLEAKAPAKTEEKEPDKSKKKDPAPPPGPATVAGPTPTAVDETEEVEEEEETGRDGVRSSPLVRRIAKENGVDLAALAAKGTGANGRITKRDILSYIEQGGSPAKTGVVGREPKRRPDGGVEYDRRLEELTDPESELGRQWDQEHDTHVLRRLLELSEPEFTAPTWLAFRRLDLEGRPAAEVARELGTTVNAVLLSRSRVLRHLRREARGLVD
jgi:pyruvate/2-oxoglutarate dehydrogenase complex dihydrolipoamide acyltransferase (E2) component